MSERKHFGNDPVFQKACSEKGVAAAARFKKGGGKTTHINLDGLDLPGTRPGGSLLGHDPARQIKHAQSRLAILRTEKSVDGTFNFYDKLIATGSRLLDQRTWDDCDIRIITEARQAAGKLIDKTVPDIIASQKEDSQTPVQVYIGAHIARLIHPPAAEVSDGRAENDPVSANAERPADS